MDEEMVEAFRTFDIDSKGFINIKDLERTLKAYNENLQEDEIKIMFNEADQDKDGKIDFKDFVLMMMAK